MLIRLALLSSYLLTSMALMPPKRVPLPAGDTARLLQRLGEQFIKDTAAVGLSIAVVSQGKASFYNYGTTVKGLGHVPTSRTVYEIGSVTKTFTGLLLAQAVAEKKIKLDDDIRRYLPGQYPNLEYQGQPIRVVNLINLTSELPNVLPDDPTIFTANPPDSIPAALVRRHQGYTKQAFYNDLHQVRLAAIPGSKPRHSNVGPQLLGYILEDIYLTSYEALLRRCITHSLKMGATALTVAPANVAQRATGFDARGSKMPPILSDSRSAGGLTSSTEDMAKYLLFQLNERNETVKRSHQVTWTDTKERHIGFSWEIYTSDKGRRGFWHSGGTFGFSSFVMLCPQMNSGVVLLANESDTQMQTKLAQMADEIMTSIEQE